VNAFAPQSVQFAEGEDEVVGEVGFERGESERGAAEAGKLLFEDIGGERTTFGGGECHFGTDFDNVAEFITEDES